jgi:predicted O-methyltransferase YrrM
LYSAYQSALKYARYYLKASNGKGHGVHSPFVFEFIKFVLNDKTAYPAYQNIETLRAQLKKNEQCLTIKDFGAGSKITPYKQRSVASIAKSALKPPKYAQLLHRMVSYYHCKNILELGTSLGVTTAYLAASKATNVITMEGAKEVADVAKQNFQQLGLTNIRLIEGNFDDTLSTALKQMPSIDLAFIDGNHRRQPTIQYFHQLLPALHDNSIVVFDDIHWSSDMEEAWEHIRQHEAVSLSIDLFFIGIVFFSKDFKVKQHFSVRF